MNVSLYRYVVLYNIVFLFDYICHISLLCSIVHHKKKLFVLEWFIFLYLPRRLCIAVYYSMHIVWSFCLLYWYMHLFLCTVKWKILNFLFLCENFYEKKYFISKLYIDFCLKKKNDIFEAYTKRTFLINKNF